MKNYRDPVPDFFEERGDIPLNPPAFRVPPGAIIRDDIRQTPSKVGNAIGDYSVESVFTTRPINAYDVILPNTVEGGTGNFSIPFTVADNKVLIITGIQMDLTVYNAEYLPPNNNMFLTLLLNGQPITRNVNIPVVNLFGVRFPVYFIAGPGSIVNVQVSVLVGPSTATDALFLFFGTELLSQGRATQYEIANEGKLGVQPA